MFHSVTENSQGRMMEKHRGTWNLSPGLSERDARGPQVHPTIFGYIKSFSNRKYTILIPCAWIFQLVLSCSALLHQSKPAKFGRHVAYTKRGRS